MVPKSYVQIRTQKLHIVASKQFFIDPDDMWFNGNQKFWESCWKFERNLNFGRQTEQVCYLYLSCFLCSIFGFFIFSLWFKAFLNIIKDFLSILVEKYKYLFTTHTIQGKNSKKIKKCSSIRLHTSIGGPHVADGLL